MVTHIEAPKNSVLHRAAMRLAGAQIPRDVHLEVTYHCNLKCRHCLLEPCLNKPHDDELSTSEWCAILDQLFEAGAFLVVFSGGEPLCRPDIFDLMNHAKERGLFFDLKTNGTLVTEQSAQRLKDLGVGGVDISLYGATQQTHEYVTGVVGSYARTLRAIKLLREHKIRVRITTPIMKSNFGENRELKNLAAELGATYEPNPLIMPKIGQPHSADHLRVNDEQLKTFLRERNDEEDLKLDNADHRQTKVESCISCTAGKLRFAVSPLGEVFPCSTWRVPLGNLKKQKFMDIRNGEAARKAREIGVADRPVCASCELIGYCSPCRGLAHIAHGSISGPFSESCRIARALKEVREDDRD